MPRTKLHKPKPTLEQQLQPEQITVQMEGSVLEAALVDALQPLYQEIAELKKEQEISSKALTSLIAENPIPGIDADSVSRSVAGFVERREVERKDTAEFIAQLTQTTIQYFNTKQKEGDSKKVNENIEVVESPDYWIWYGHNRENGKTPRLMVQDKETKSVLFETLRQEDGWKAEQVKPEAAAWLEQASRELAAGQRREPQIQKPQMEL